MPLLIWPLVAGGAGFVSGWFSNDKYGWMKWVAVAVIAYLILKKQKLV